MACPVKALVLDPALESGQELALALDPALESGQESVLGPALVLDQDLAPVFSGCKRLAYRNRYRSV